VKLTYDPAKNAANIRKHGIALPEAEYFEWETAEHRLDTRNDYGEPRIISIGWLSNRLHTVVYTLRTDEVRVISLHKSNRKEKESYEKKQEIF
jgi:hypothetical protein